MLIIVYPFSEKPNAITPNNPYKVAPPLAPNDDVIEKIEFLDSMHGTLKSTHGVPKQRFKYPMTSNQEFGWFNFDTSDRPQTTRSWNHYLNSTAITQFAANYEQLQAINPFKVKERGQARPKEGTIMSLTRPPTTRLPTGRKTAKTTK